MKPAGLIEHPFRQGTEQWLEARRGVTTASRAKDARDRSTGLTAQQQAYVDAVKAGRAEADAMALAGYKKTPTAENVEKAIAGNLTKQWGAAAIAYAMDLARERCGGKAPSINPSAAMRTGSEEEPFAAIEYVARTGSDVTEAVFLTTPDKKFGMSLDRWVGDTAALEIKTMVSSTTLFKAVVDGDISEYRDQCLFGLWLLNLEWIDLCLWAPDLPNPLHVVRITRDEDAIQALEDDLMDFDRLVSSYEAKLRAKLTGAPAPWEGPDELAKARPAPRVEQCPDQAAINTNLSAAKLRQPLPADIFG